MHDRSIHTNNSNNAGTPLFLTLIGAPHETFVLNGFKRTNFPDKEMITSLMN